MPADNNPQAIVKEIEHLFDSRGSSWYGGESISQLEHALQSAMFAEQEDASPEMIVAALLHDVGHLLHDLPEDIADEGIDDHHEVLGRRWLAKRFPQQVSTPVEMHVAAKRYLCAKDPAYLESLSPASKLSLELQKGIMSEEETRQFEASPDFERAIQLRRWDDRAKIVGLETPKLDHFMTYIAQACGAESN